MIRIVEAEAEGGKLYSVDNRRLGVFRLLEMTGKTKIVKVEYPQLQGGLKSKPPGPLRPRV